MLFCILFEDLISKTKVVSVGNVYCIVLIAVLLQ